MSTLLFYIDDACTDTGDFPNITAQNEGVDGYCTLFNITGWQSFKVQTIFETCAFTVYDSQIQWCSGDYTTLRLGECMPSATTDVNQFSLDCQGSSTALTTASSEPSASSDGGLSTGAQAGIGVGVSLIVIAAIAAVVFFLLRRRRKASPGAEENRAETISEMSGTKVYPAEVGDRYSAHMIPYNKRQPTNSAVEAPGDGPTKPVFEMDAGMDAGRPRARTFEMSADSETWADHTNSTSTKVSRDWGHTR